MRRLTYWLLVLAFVVHTIGVRMIAWLLALLALLLVVLLLSSCAAPHYCYHEAHVTERRYNRVVRYYRHQNRRDARELHRDHVRQQHALKRAKKQFPTGSKFR